MYHAVTIFERTNKEKKIFLTNKGRDRFIFYEQGTLQTYFSLKKDKTNLFLTTQAKF